MKFTLKYYLSVKLKGIAEYAVVYSAALFFYLLTLTQNFSAAHDSITYLNDIVHKENLFHPHHLLYNSAASVWLNGIKYFFKGVDSSYLIASFTALWGSGIILISWLFFRIRFQMKVLPAIAAVGVIAFSYGVWFYSTNIEVYAPSVFFMLWLLFELTGDRKQKASSFGNIAILHCIAILFHQVNIIFAIVILYLIWKENKERFLRVTLSYCLTGLLLVGGAYFYTGWFVEGNNNIESWLHWVLGYTYGHSYWSAWSLGTIPAVITGFAHAIIGGQFLFKIDFLNSLLVNKIQGHHLDDEIFLVENVSNGTAVFLLVLCIAAAIIMLALLLKFLYRKPWKTSANKQMYVILIICLLLYSFFFSFWEPEILEFWILQSVILWILLLGRTSDIHQKTNKPLLATTFSLAALLFIINFLGSMKWLMNRENDLFYNHIAILATECKTSDLIVLENPWILDEYISYFLKMEPAGKEAFLQEIDSAELPTDRRIVYIADVEASTETFSNQLGLSIVKIKELYAAKKAYFFEKQAE